MSYSLTNMISVFIMCLILHRSNWVSTGEAYVQQGICLAADMTIMMMAKDPTCIIISTYADISVMCVINRRRRLVIQVCTD